MKKPRILSVCLLAILLLLNACGITPPAETPGEPAGTSQQVYGGENARTPDNDTDSPQTEGIDADSSVDFEDGVDMPQTGETREDASVDSKGYGADAAPGNASDERLPLRGEYYYDLTSVVLYLDAYGELPPNYITKNDARALGWNGGSVEPYQDGAAIGGDFFGNYEGLLPDDDGQRYTECDIDTDGYPSRGSRRLVFSNDGRYFYTSDHYESFTEYRVTADYEVIPCE